MKVSAFLTTLALTLFLSSAHAQEAQLEIIAERPSQSNNSDPAIQQLRLLVTFDTDVNDSQNSGDTYTFQDALISIELEIYDPQNTMTNRYVYTPESANVINWMSVSKPSNLQEQSMVADIMDLMTNISFRLNRIDPNAPTIEAPIGFDNGFPKVKEVVNQIGSYTFDVFTMNGQQRGIQVIDFDAHTVRYVVLDEDGDGITDDLDQCPVSITTSTVVFGWLDSGVTNDVDANGCTISDRYMACQEIVAAAATDIPSFQGPTYCEMQVTYSLYRDGLVDYSDVRQLRNSMITFYSSSPSIR